MPQAPAQLPPAAPAFRALGLPELGHGAAPAQPAIFLGIAAPHTALLMRSGEGQLSQTLYVPEPGRYTGLCGSEVSQIFLMSGLLGPAWDGKTVELPRGWRGTGISALELARSQ